MPVRQRLWSTGRNWVTIDLVLCMFIRMAHAFPKVGLLQLMTDSMVCVCASLFAVVVSTRMLQVATETELISRSETFEQAMKDNALAQFCDYKVSGSEGEDQETWLYLRILFEADPKRYQAPSQNSFDTPRSIHHLAVLPATMTSSSQKHGTSLVESSCPWCLQTFCSKGGLCLARVGALTDPQ